ncbi:MAG TPA: rhodanese-like domain-containing protein [Aggregatilineaceae bacterium]|nr:rhodanese-like domain-containing protein [Aggregatilineaceae bacterium]
MMKRIMLLLVVVILVLTACGDDKDNDKNDDKKPTATPTVGVVAVSGYQTLAPDEANQQFQASDNAILVDVRTPEEWAETGIPVGAKTLTWQDEFVAKAASELPKDAEIYVICRSGNRSAQASQWLIEQGYTKVFNIEGGITEWMKSQAVEPYQP